MKNVLLLKSNPLYEETFFLKGKLTDLEFTSNQNVAQTASYISKYLTDNDYELENSQYGDEAVIDQDTDDLRVITGYKGKTILTISIWKKQPEVHIDYTLMQ